MRRPGKGGPASSRLKSKASAPQRLHQRKGVSIFSKTKPSDGDSVAATGGRVADAFFGASPVVASALDLRSGATPAERDDVSTTEKHWRARSYS